MGPASRTSRRREKRDKTIMVRNRKALGRYRTNMSYGNIL
jgi:hypothetical protein